jgi:hypothetical protein
MVNQLWFRHIGMLSVMEIPVRIQLLDSEGGRGVKLWVIAQDGSRRAWFKWYKDAGTASIDAEKMGLIELPVLYSPSSDRHALSVRRRLLTETTIDESVLETHWRRASNPPTPL